MSPAFENGHTFTPTPDGRYGLGMSGPTYQHSPIRFFDLRAQPMGFELVIVGGGPAGLSAAARKLDSIFARVQTKLTDNSVKSRERQILEEILRTGADGEYLDYVSAEQAFMAVQMLAYELKDAAMQAELDALADALDDDERYRPSQFACLLRNL